jgi:GTP-binding protein Era
MLVVNKIDTIHPKEKLLPELEKLAQKANFAAVVPLSAHKGTNVADLEKEIAKLLPEGEFLYGEEQITDRDAKFLAAEIIREKLIKSLGEELPYAITIIIDQFEEAEKEGMLNISATIFVEREGQKAIVIGKNGEKLKKIGTYAREELEQLLHKKIYLKLWVKVKSSWSNDEKVLEELGYL